MSKRDKFHRLLDGVNGMYRKDKEKDYLYLAHPLDSRHIVRNWETRFEKGTGIDLLNPFYDTSERLIIKQIDMGVRDRYDVSPKQTVEKCIECIEKGKGLVAIIDESKRSVGTKMEIPIAARMGKPVYLLVTNGEEEHPWYKYYATGIAKSFKELEEMLVKKYGKK